MRARILLSAAALLASAACSSLPKPVVAPGAAQPAVASGDAPGLAVWTPGSANGVGGAVASATYFSVDRDAYAAAFAVTRDGRLRVVWPESPSEDGMVRGGKTYGANASFVQYGSFMTGPRNAVPYVFVIVSDQRLDLARFGQGSRWRYQVNLEGLGAYADDAVESVASVVLPHPEASYAADYAYVTPRLTGAAQFLALSCGIRNTDARNYSYFRDLWAVFDPWDSYLGPATLGTAWAFFPGAWFPFNGRGMLGMYLDRASRANAAFWGGCGGGFSPFSVAGGLPYGFANRGFGLPGGNGTVAGGTGVIGGVPRDTTARPGDRLRVRPSEVFGAPGTQVARGPEGEERRAALRERIAEGRERAERTARERESAFRTERLTSIDVAGLERRARAAELAELGFVGRDRALGRGGRDDPFARPGSAFGPPQDRGRSPGRAARGAGSADGFGGRSGVIESRGGGADRAAGRSGGEGGGSRGAEARGAGGQSSGGSGSGSGEGGGSRRP